MSQTWGEWSSSWNNMCATGGGVAAAQSTSAAATVPVGANPVAKKADAEPSPREEETWGAYFSSWNNMCATGGGGALSTASQ